jgi:hypothetical protein
MPTFGCSLHCNIGAIYSAHTPVYAMWTVVPHIYNAFTAPHIQASILKCTYLRCFSRYLDIWMPVTLLLWCHIKRTPSSVRYVNCDPAHIQCNYSSAYSGFNIQLNVSGLLLEISRQFNAWYRKIGAKYSTHRSVYAMWTVVPDIYNVYTAPHIQASILNWTYLRCCWRYADIWMRLILQLWCHM